MWLRQLEIKTRSTRLNTLMVWSSTKAGTLGILPLFLQKTLTSFSPFCSLFQTQFSTGIEMSLSPFLSFCWGQTGGDTFGIHPSKKKIKIMVLILPFTFHPHSAKVKDTFTCIPLPQSLLPSGVLRLKPNCHAEIEHGHPGKAHPCIYPASYILLFLKRRGRGDLNKTYVSRCGRISLGLNSLKGHSHDTLTWRVTDPSSDFWDVLNHRNALRWGATMGLRDAL